MNHGEKARHLFMEGCNCAQAVFTAFCDVTGLPARQAMRLSSSFGGGIGRMREVCGAVSGACMVLGWLYGYDTPGDDAAKAAHYARVQELAKGFRERHGSLLCRELLEKPDTSPNPTARTEAFYHSRPCAQFVYDAAELVDRYIEAHPLEEKTTDSQPE